ncbi:MAG: 50S ribosomal protein L19 [Candidatus Omnitrophica bacterium]|nr:50S ribosomal protein L19 [Candidatus Omnitrophota bacterium]
MAGRLSKLQLVEKNQIRKDIPEFNVGDTVKMKIKVQEADKVRLHGWEGVVIAKRGAGIQKMFTVRKVTFGEGVEKTFPINSPVIAGFKVVSTGKVKRAKLFYLRDKSGKSARINSELVTSGGQELLAAKAA